MSQIIVDRVIANEINVLKIETADYSYEGGTLENTSVFEREYKNVSLAAAWSMANKLLEGAREKVTQQDPAGGKVPDNRFVTFHWGDIELMAACPFKKEKDDDLLCRTRTITIINYFLMPEEACSLLSRMRIEMANALSYKTQLPRNENDDACADSPYDVHVKQIAKELIGLIVKNKKAHPDELHKKICDFVMDPDGRWKKCTGWENDACTPETQETWVNPMRAAMLAVFRRYQLLALEKICVEHQAKWTVQACAPLAQLIEDVNEISENLESIIGHVQICLQKKMFEEENKILIGTYRTLASVTRGKYAPKI